MTFSSAIIKPAFITAVCILLSHLSCRDPAPTPRPPRRQTPIPEKTSTTGLVNTSPPHPIVHRTSSIVKGAEATQFETPGAVRWTLNLGKPITFMRWSPLAGLVVSAGNDVHNVTSRGNHRWRFVAGKNHRLFVVDEAEIVWSPAFSRLNQLLRGGRQGWSRNWSGKIATGGNGKVYLLDASTVAALGADGRDRWRASPEGVRELEGPFPCEDGTLFHGLSGLQRVAARISSRGSVMRETSLERGSVLIGASPGCEPLIWIDDEVALLNPGGHPIWKRPAPVLPFVRRINGGFVLIHSLADRPAHLQVLNDDGRIYHSGTLPVSGRLTNAQIIQRDDFGVKTIGLCLDVTSPCSRPDENRGPFNAILTSTGRDDYRVLIRHVKGHLSFSAYNNHSIVIANSKTARETKLTLRNSDYSITWQVTLPGRLSAGPYVGPKGEIYVATCSGWECDHPHLLISITGRTPPDANTVGDEGISILQRHKPSPVFQGTSASTLKRIQN
jgi:hypothetical protein